MPSSATDLPTSSTVSTMARCIAIAARRPCGAASRARLVGERGPNTSRRCGPSAEPAISASRITIRSHGSARSGSRRSRGPCSRRRRWRRRPAGRRAGQVGARARPAPVSQPERPGPVDRGRPPSRRGTPDHSDRGRSAVKFGIFYELQLPAAVGRGRRVRADPATRSTRSSWPTGSGYDYAWEVEHHFLEEYCHSSAPEVFLAAASQRTKNIRLGHGIVQLHHEPSGACRRAGRDARPGQRRPRRVGHRRGRERHRAASVRPPLPRQARGLGGRRAVRACRCSARRAGSTTASTSTSRCATSCRSRAEAASAAVGGVLQLDTIEMAGRRGMGALGFQFVSADAAQAWVQRLLQLVHEAARQAVRLPDQPEHRRGQRSCAPTTDEEAQADGRRLRRSSSSRCASTTPHGPVEPGHREPVGRVPGVEADAGGPEGAATAA